MSAGHYVLARGSLPDEVFATLEALAVRLLSVIDDLGQGDAVICLRDANTARPHAPSGPCVAVSTLTETGGWAGYGLAYVFQPWSADPRQRLEAAMRAASPQGFKPAGPVVFKQRAAA